MKKCKHQAVIMLGGNIGDTICLFESTRSELKAAEIEILAESAVFRSEPWGNELQRSFLNQCLLIETDKNPDSLMNLLQKIELSHGKNTLFENGPRTLDLDIIFYDDLILNSPTLKIPHPRAHLRRFNLLPMAQIVPDFIHPVIKMTVFELLNDCKDPLEIHGLNCLSCT
ncbi:MAG: 2-amino-4-hydroxy-6-hydroxymethyldihydropteridine diphosphokinase [Bacteroidota bacterium]